MQAELVFTFTRLNFCFPVRVPGDKVANLAPSLQNLCHLQAGERAPAGWRKKKDSSVSGSQPIFCRGRAFSSCTPTGAPVISSPFHVPWVIWNSKGLRFFWTGGRRDGWDQVELVPPLHIVDVLCSVPPASNRPISPDEIMLRCNVC